MLDSGKHGRRTWRRRSFRRRTIAVILIVSVGVLVSVLDRNGFFALPDAHNEQNAERDSGDVASSDYQKYHNKRFRVIHSIDGDTFDINIPDGRFSRTRVRLLGVDTPEIHRNNRGVITGFEHFASEASDFTRNKTHGKMVTLELIEGKTRDNTSSKRLLAYVYTEDGTMLNRQLIQQGYGFADSRSPHTYRREFAEEMKTAREKKRGLWKNQGTLPPYVNH